MLGEIFLSLKLAELQICICPFRQLLVPHLLILGFLQFTWVGTGLGGLFSSWERLLKEVSGPEHNNKRRQFLYLK
jgi:hypothetical protein